MDSWRTLKIEALRDDSDDGLMGSFEMKKEIKDGDDDKVEEDDEKDDDGGAEFQIWDEEEDWRCWW